MRLMNGDCGQGGIAVTPSDDTNLTQAVRGLWVGVAGDIKITGLDGNAVQFTNVPVGFWQMGCVRVWDTGTDADELVGIL